jgi:hypothetical protein
MLRQSAIRSDRRRPGTATPLVLVHSLHATATARRVGINAPVATPSGSGRRGSAGSRHDRHEGTAMTTVTGTATRRGVAAAASPPRDECTTAGVGRPSRPIGSA